jgi:hypothetical protein
MKALFSEDLFFDPASEIAMPCQPAEVRWLRLVFINPFQVSGSAIRFQVSTQRNAFSVQEIQTFGALLSQFSYRPLGQNNYCPLVQCTIGLPRNNLQAKSSIWEKKYCQFRHSVCHKYENTCILWGIDQSLIYEMSCKWLICKYL